jgi:hypothetical protein
MDEPVVEKSLLPDKKHAPKKTGKRGVHPPKAKAKKKEKPLGGASLFAKQPAKPTVIGDRFQAFYLGPVLKEVKGKKTVGLRLSVELTQDHEKLLPDIMLRGYKNVLKKGQAGSKMRDIPAQNVRLYLSQDTKEEAVALLNAGVLQANINVIEKKGEGETRTIIRLIFIARVKHSRTVASWADDSYGASYWVTMEEVEPDLLDLDEEDEDE